MRNSHYDSCFYGAKVLNVFTKKWENLDIYISQEKVAALLPPENKIPVKETFDCSGKKGSLALPVIPSIRLTDSGLFDVEKWQFLK